MRCGGNEESGKDVDSTSCAVGVGSGDSVTVVVTVAIDRRGTIQEMSAQQQIGTTFYSYQVHNACIGIHVAVLSCIII